MTLESKFEKLSIGDESSIIDAIKKDGVDKSGFADNIDVLVAKCASTDDAEALAAMATSKALAEGCPEAEAFNIDCLTPCKFALVSAHGNLLIPAESTTSAYTASYNKCRLTNGASRFFLQAWNK